MTTEVEMSTPQSAGFDQASEPPARPCHKSFRRKYRKIMVKFEDKMRESNNLFKEEQRILDISGRLSVQNDQILELLYDLNNCPQLPARLRYDLQPSGRSTTLKELPVAKPAAQHLSELSNASAALREARHELRKGDIPMAEYQRLSEDLLAKPGFAPAKSFKSLSKMMPRSGVKAEDAVRDHDERLASGFPSASQEEQHLQSIDTYLASGSSNQRITSNGLIPRYPDRVNERDRDLAMRNPVSVYNWLRKHQPQVFLQDNDNNPDKAARAPARASKRASAHIKVEQDLYDEDGVALDLEPAARGKRKRDDDRGYRPKGGNARPAKRRKDEVAASTRKTKKTPSVTSASI